MTRTEALARFLAERDGVDPERSVMRAGQPLRTSVGPLHILFSEELNFPRAWTLFEERAAEILVFLDNLHASAGPC